MPAETLIDGYTFFVTDGPTALGETGGLYHRDTRHLSRLAVRLDGDDPVPMGRTDRGANRRRVTLATAAPAVNEMDDGNVAKHTEVVVERDQHVREGVGYEEAVTLSNHAARARTVRLTVAFDADFADIFEVRGLRSGIDRTVETDVGDRAVSMRYRYEGTSGTTTERETTVRFGVTPASLDAGTATFEVELDPQASRTIPVAVAVDGADASPPLGDRPAPVTLPTVRTGTPRYDEVFAQAATDLTALTTVTDHGAVPLAGTPWFATPFGRDSLIAAYQALPVAPELAVGTLRYLAAHQGATDDPTREEAPGKMFHEIRHGELADREAIPHTPYYGTVDATPLWVILLAETCDWRGDDRLAVELADSLDAALSWIRRQSGAVADDPFVYYGRSGTGLDHKAWKDTADSVRFSDGEVAETPLAVAEVQGYAAAALRRGADLRDRIDRDGAVDPAADRRRAAAIERAFDEEFWLPDRSFYALAKTGDGRVVDAVSSNVGHCLWTATVPGDRADAVVETLLGEGLFSGWGLRTMSTEDDGYSPVSYHAGGVWPHDTSLVALGLSNYGYGAAAERLGGAVLDAAASLPDARVPELYCGFDRDRDPVSYPAACAPQAWGAGAPFAVLRAAFGLEPTDCGVDATRSPDLFADDAVKPIRRRWRVAPDESHPSL